MRSWISKVAALMLLIAMGRVNSATILVDEQFAGSGTVPAGWLNLGPSIGGSGTVGYSNGLLTMSTPSFAVILNNGNSVTPTGMAVTVKTSIVSFSGRWNETAFGNNFERFGFLLTDTGQVAVYRFSNTVSGCTNSSWNGILTSNCILSLPAIAGYSGGPLEVTLSADAVGLRLTTNTGYDSGVIGYSSLPGALYSLSNLTSSYGVLIVRDDGVSPNTTSSYDRLRIYTATGADAQTVSSATTQTATTATTTLSVTSTGSVSQTAGTTTVLQTMTVDADGTYTLSSGTLDASTIEVDGTFNFNGGTLSVDDFQGDLTNQGGTLSPGNSPGLTSITGDYDQQSAGALLIELAGLNAVSEYDQVQVSGTATLGGTLDIDLLYGFIPAAGDSFDILLANVVSGTFGTTLFPSLPAGLVWNLQYLIDAIGSTDVVRLSVQEAVPVPGAVWLFGGALGALGVLKRKAATA